MIDLKREKHILPPQVLQLFSLLNVTRLLHIFVFFDKKWLMCTTRAFFGSNFPKLPHIHELIFQIDPI